MAKPRCRGERAILPVPAGVRAPGVSRPGCARLARSRTPRPCSPGGAAHRTAPLAAAGPSAQRRRAPAGNRPGATGSRRWRGRAEAGWGEPPRRAGTSTLRRRPAGRAGDADGTRRPGAGRTPRPGRPVQGSPEGCLEVPPPEPAVGRQTGHYRDERREPEPGVTLGGEIEDVPLPALPADQEIERIFVQIGEGDLKDTRGLLSLHRRREHQAGNRQDQTPHDKTMVRNACASQHRPGAPGAPASCCVNAAPPDDGDGLERRSLTGTARLRRANTYLLHARVARRLLPIWPGGSTSLRPSGPRAGQRPALQACGPSRRVGFASIEHFHARRGG